MNFNESNKEVLVTKDVITTIGPMDIQSLKARALNNKRRRVRLCTHKNLDDKVHEMLIVHVKNTYARPHRHLDKSESFHIIEGELDVVIFQEDGSIEAVVEMGDVNTSRHWYYRLSESLYHTVLIRSDIAVFHETTSGPFLTQERVFAPWSPVESMIDEARGYLDELDCLIAAFKKSSLQLESRCT